MGRDQKIKNAFKRSEMHRKDKREKEQAKLKRRMEIRKAEKSKDGGAELKRARLEKNVPRTIDNTRIYDSSSYLTADPASLRAAAERATEASRAANGVHSQAGPSARNGDSEGEDAESDEEDEDGDEEDEEEADMEEDTGVPEAGPSRRTLLPTQPVNGDFGPQEDAEGDGQKADSGIQANGMPSQPNGIVQPPPRILITTSPSPCKDTYAFCDDLRGIFPGGEFFKRPKGKGYEIGRLARWAAKRGYGAVLVVNEDHKKANAVTIMTLPAGPTAYFKLSSTRLGHEIYGRARPTPHSPELILNNFTTLLGHSVGRLFGSLFPPQPQFRGRQVVTLHNQRDFLFFRRHRYVFDSVTKARLQEIGPRFTLKLRWLKKGLPSVTAADGRIPGGAGPDHPDDQESLEGNVGQDGGDAEESREEDEAMAEIGIAASTANGVQKGKKGPTDAELGIPALDDEQEYEWKWKPKMEVSRRTFFL